MSFQPVHSNSTATQTAAQNTNSHYVQTNTSQAPKQNPRNIQLSQGQGTISQPSLQSLLQLSASNPGESSNHAHRPVVSFDAQFATIQKSAVFSTAPKSANTSGTVSKVASNIASYTEQIPILGEIISALSSNIGSVVSLFTAATANNAVDSANTGNASGLFNTVARGLSEAFGDHKHPDVIARDQLRGFLQSQNFIDADSNVQLADGSTYNIGQEGRPTLANVDGTVRRPYDTDASNPLTAQVIGWINPLAEILTGGDDKLRSDLAGYLTNAATSNAKTLDDARQNVLAFYGKLGASENDFRNALVELGQSGGITNEQFAAYQNGISTLIAQAQ